MIFQSILFFIVCLIIYLSGKIVSALIKLELNNSNTYFKIFINFFFGIFSSIILSSLVFTNGKTSFIFLLVPIIIYFLKNKQSLKFRNLYLFFDKQEIITVVSILIITVIISMKLYTIFGVKENCYIFPDMDLIFYGDLSKHILNIGLEDAKMPVFSNIHSMSPYHYSDIYFNILLSKTLNISPYLSYRIYLYSMMLILIFVGIISILNSKFNLIFSLIFTVIVLISTFYQIQIGENNLVSLTISNFIVFPKLCIPTLFILATYLFFKNNEHKTALYILNSLSILFTNLIFVVLILTILYIIWLMKNKNIKIKDLLGYFIMYFFYFIYIYLFYVRIKISNQNNYFDYFDFYKQLAEQEIAILYNFLILLIILFISQKKKLSLYLLCSLIFSIIPPYLFKNIDSIQLFTNFAWASFTILIAIFISEVSMNKYLLLTLMTILCITIKYNSKYKFELSGIIIPLDLNIQEQIKKKTNINKLENAIFIRRNTTYLQNSHLFNSNFYRMGYWINAVNPNITFSSIFDLTMYRKYPLFHNNVLDRNYFHVSLENSFIKYSSNFKSTIDTKYILNNYIMENNIKYALVEPGAEILFNKKYISDSIINHFNNERFYILANTKSY